MSGGDYDRYCAARDVDVHEIQVANRGHTHVSTVNYEVTVIGIPADRSAGAMTASRFFSAAIEPLLRRIALVVQDRPELIADEASLDTFESALNDAERYAKGEPPRRHSTLWRPSETSQTSNDVPV